MKFKIKLNKIGGSYFFSVPKSIIDVFNLLENGEEWELSAYKDGKVLSYKKIIEEKNEN